MKAEQVIIEPVLTEKSNLQRESNRYIFRVNPRANKIEVMRAVAELFNVHPRSCNIMRVKGKPRRVRYRMGYTAGWKKAIVTIEAGEVISIFEST